MKKLVLITVLTTSTLTAKAACEITFEKKTAKAKTAYIDGVSVSSKIRDALASKCKLKYRVMSEAEVKQMDIARLKKRLAKLQAE